MVDNGAVPIRLHTAARADALLAPLVRLVAQPLADPLQSEVIAVPTRAMERWLAQQLAQVLGARDARRDGICANIEFCFPGSVIGRAIAAAGVDGDEDPWRPERAAWQLLEVVEDAEDLTAYGPLATHLGRGSGAGPDLQRAGRRFGVLRHIADLFDRYAMHRPEMVRAWAAGRAEDGDGNALPSQWAWQAALWRSLRERIGEPSMPERLPEACERIRAVPEAVDLPPRLAIVGVSGLPATYLQVVRAVGAARDIELCLLHPSPVLWDAVATLPLPHGPLRRPADPSVGLVRHPVLASWGRDAREMQLVLGADPPRATAATQGRDRDTLLGRLQADIRHNREPRHGAGGLADDDWSIQIHACHGRARQVEVLRDAILHVLRRDPTLEPRDVLVMCPDIAAFAPLIAATFGTPDEAASAVDPLSPVLPVQLADRSLRDANPVAAVVARVMALADERVTSTQLLELAASDPVRRRFGFDDADIERIQQLVADAGIRWGLDGGGRALFGLAGVEANTWRAGVDRMLVGIAVGADDDQPVAGIAPLGGLDTGAIEIVGRLAEFVERVGVAVDRLRRAQPIAAWADAVAATADLLTDPGPAAAWQRMQMDDLLADLVAQAGEVSLPITATEMRGLFRSLLQDRPGMARYRTGRVTVTGLVPMRGVPHRVICLLGLDGASFPRAAGQDGDDIMLGAPMVGDRDPRGDDVQQLLDAVLAAGDHLIVTYSGHDPRTNVALPPPVPVAELRDVLGRMVPDGLAGRVWVDHPLQPFDPRNFRAAALVRDTVWGFDPVAAAGARALLAGPGPAAPFLERPLPPRDDAVIELSALLRFVEHPVREFLSARLGIRLGGPGDELPDGIPLGLNALEQWSVGDRMLRAVRDGRDLEAWAAGEALRGTLPPGRLGRDVLDRIAPVVVALAAEADAQRAGRTPRAVAVDMRLADGRRIVGTVDRVYDDLLLSVGYSRLGPTVRLRAWVRLLALTAGMPGGAYRSVAIGRGRDHQHGDTAISRIEPLDSDAATAALARVVALYDAGMRAPLMVFARTSEAYADGVLAAPAARPATRRLKELWEGRRSSGVPGENRDPANVLVLGGVLGFDELWERHGDALRAAARTLWADLLAAERRSP